MNWGNWKSLRSFNFQHRVSSSWLASRQKNSGVVPNSYVLLVTEIPSSCGFKLLFIVNPYLGKRSNSTFFRRNGPTTNAEAVWVHELHSVDGEAVAKTMGFLGWWIPQKSPWGVLCAQLRFVLMIFFWVSRLRSWCNWGISFSFRCLDFKISAKLMEVRENPQFMVW